VAHTIYRRPTAHGDLYRQVVGLSGLVEAEGGAFTVPAEILKAAEIGEPQVGDKIRDGSRQWWSVTLVGAPDGGLYTLEASPA
jgi:hypothetical protein